MAKGMKHYFRDGTEHTGATHKDDKGKLMSGAKHTKNSKFLYHFKELSKTAQKKARPVKMSSGGSTVNAAGNYTQPGLRKRIFNSVKAGGKGGAPGQWSARKAQLVASKYKKAGGDYRD
jgi:hypothetical protein